jgi:hypothetical protein
MNGGTERLPTSRSGFPPSQVSPELFLRTATVVADARLCQHGDGTVADESQLQCERENVAVTVSAVTGR